MLDGISQTPLDQVDLFLGCGDTPLGFLLEEVQHINSVRNQHSIDCAPGIAREVLDDLQNACTAKSLEWLCIRRPLAPLYPLEGVADAVLDLVRTAAKVLQGRSHPIDGLERR